MARRVKVLVDDAWYTVEFLGAQGTHLQVRVNGSPFEVEIHGIEIPSSLHTQRYSSPHPMRGNRPTAAPQHSREPTNALSDAYHITAPMTGRIVRISVKLGEQIKPGDEVCVLEAMKMEQSIQVSVLGLVKTIHVHPDQVVTSGDLLVEIE